MKKFVMYKGIKILLKGFFNEVINTDNYSIFKKYKYNREKDEKHIKKIMDLIIKNGAICPLIWVNTSMGIVHGQHTFEACRRLGVPIQYIICKDNIYPEDMVGLQYRKKWTPLNALKTYAENGNKNAEIMLKHYNKTVLSLRNKNKICKKNKENGYKLLTVMQILGIVYGDIKFTAGIVNIGGITVLNELKNVNITSRTIKMTLLYSYAMKNCKPEGANVRTQDISNALISFMKDNTIDLDKVENKLHSFKFYVNGSANYFEQLKGFYS